MTCCEGNYKLFQKSSFGGNSIPVKPSPNLTPNLNTLCLLPLPSAEAIQPGLSGQCLIARYFSNLFWEFSALQTILFQFA